MVHWANESIFYHIYPLGFCGAPEQNDLGSPPVSRLDKVCAWIPHLKSLGVNALYLGPLFESSRHGYDTADYYRVDRRLGDNAALFRAVDALHQNCIRVVLDGVFNHVGRDFWAFRDVQAHRERSAYCDWFHGLDFRRTSPCGDSFAYEGWNGHYDLVKLNLGNPAVRAHLLDAAAMWIDAFAIDGLRLDAADCVEIDFLQALAAHCKRLRPDFWLLGEVIHGDYRRWANAGTLDSTTNYECYKGLYSSHVDVNYFEIAYSLNRQFGEGGLYRGLPLYAFADNHDVDRVASRLSDPAHLYPLYCLLFSMPGVPSIYYGSEWGIQGRKSNGSDAPLRPCLELDAAPRLPHHKLAETIARLARVRLGSPALKYGDYRQLDVRHEQLAFARRAEDQCVLVLVNAAAQPAAFRIPVPARGSHLVDLLNEGDAFPIVNGQAAVDPVWAHWARILRVEG